MSEIQHDVEYFTPVITHELIEETEHLPLHFDFDFAADTTIPIHWHNYFELIYLLKGEMTAIVQTRKYVLRPGDLLMINIGELHMTQLSSPDTTYMLLQISSQYLQQICPEISLRRFEHFIPRDIVSASLPLSFSITEMMSIFSAKKEGYQFAFMARVHDLLSLLYRQYSVRKLSVTDTSHDRDLLRIISLINWLQHNYQKPLSLSQAADQLGLSREYFCRLFKKYTGQSFLEYLNTLRTISFYKEFLYSDLSITALMEKHGIKNYKVFLRNFKKIYNTTPQKLRTSSKLHKTSPQC